MDILNVVQVSIFYLYHLIYVPHIISIISKQIHVYIIGDVDKRNHRHIINVEGFNSYHYVYSRYELMDDMKTKLKQKLFLPDNTYDRIIYMNADDLFVFNRITALNNQIFSSKSRWTIGADYYDVGAPLKVTNYNDIIEQIVRDIYDKKEETNPE